MNSITRILGMLPERQVPNYLYLSTMLEVSEKGNNYLDKAMLCVIVINQVLFETSERKLLFSEAPGRSNKMQ